MKKVCSECREEKDLDAFGITKKPLANGTIGEYRRNKCKACSNKYKHIKNINKKDKTIKESEKTLETEKKYNSNFLELSQLDIRELKELLKERRNIKQYISSESKTKRTVKSFNIDNDLLKLLSEKSKLEDLSGSDIVNLAIRKYLTSI
ncbi:MAG: hypothetical protein JW924_04660 [Fusobacteriaceae bacterium]|nr:hypothetical protein [Fusobacteriaceae bacterium]